MIDGACEQDSHYVTARNGHTLVATSPILNTARGDPRHTGRELDACINSSEGGGWYITVHDAEERELARRTINLQVDADGRLCTDGYPVLGDGGGYIEVPQDSTRQEIKSDGKIVSVGRDGKYTTLGAIMLSRWTNEQGLKPIGNNCFLPTESAGEQVSATPGDGAPRLITQHLESSNVDLKNKQILLSAHDLKQSLRSSLKVLKTKWTVCQQRYWVGN